MILSDLLYIFKENESYNQIINSDIGKFFTFALSDLNNSKSQCFQDLWAMYSLTYYHGESNLVEFGAGDGIDCSNTHLIEKNGYADKVLLVEPNVNQYNKLLNNRADTSDSFNPFVCRVICENLCVSNTTGQSVRFVNTKDPNLSTIEEFVASDYNKYIRQDSIESISEVETITLYDLLLKHRMFKVAYLSIDTEGSELDIMTRFMQDNSNERFDIELITIEHNYDELKREKIYNMLTQKGYERQFTEISRWDDFYRKKSS